MLQKKKERLSKKTNRKQNFKKFVESGYTDTKLFLQACKNDENLLIYTCLKPDELQNVISYCSADVDNTEKILLHRKTDISTRIELLKMFDLPLTNIGKTNAKLTATILEARKKIRDDEFIYDFPENLKLQNKEIYELYNQTLDYNNTLTTNICNVEHVLGYGGLHGVKSGHFNGNIWYCDVSSYYPTMMIKYNYLSRNVKSAKKYEEIYNLRMKYKKEKNIRERGLKLVLNTTCGATKNKYNDLYDPKMVNQICISGQLFLVDLLEKLEPYITLIQSNTDGIMFISHNDDKIKEELQKWGNRTKFNISIDKIKEIWQKDVNNYITVFENGKIYVKGGYVKFHEGGSFSNNTATIIDTAVVQYIVNKIPVEDTINNCNDLIKFQYICKKGQTYLRVEQDNKIVNDCNRVFASKNKSKGNLYKVKENGRKDSIANLPPNCDVVNEKLETSDYTIDNVDKNWYILVAYNRINDFLKKE